MALGRHEYADLLGGKFDSTRPDDMAQFFASAPRDRPLIVYFHGGLNGRKAALANAATKLAPSFKAAGATPFFFVWRTSPLDVINANRGPVDPEASAIEGFVDHLKRELDPLRPLIDALVASFERRARPAGFLDRIASVVSGVRYLALDVQSPESAAADAQRGGLLDALSGAGANLREAQRRTRDVVGRVAARIASGRHHGIHATVVEEVLRAFFDVPAKWFALMEGDIEDAFADDDRSGGTAFLKGLATLPPGQRVLLVGHSAGSIYATRLLRRARAVLPGRRFELVLLAPAVTFELFAQMLDEGTDHIARAHCFALTDGDECNQTLLGGEAGTALRPVYPRSLLYFTAGAMEYPEDHANAADRGDVPVVGMERYYSGEGPYALRHIEGVKRFLGERENGIVWSRRGAFGPLGLASDASHHSGIDEDAATLASIAKLVARPPAA